MKYCTVKKKYSVPFEGPEGQIRSIKALSARVTSAGWSVFIFKEKNRARSTGVTRFDVLLGGLSPLAMIEEPLVDPVLIRRAYHHSPYHLWSSLQHSSGGVDSIGALSLSTLSPPPANYPNVPLGALPIYIWNDTNYLTGGESLPYIDWQLIPSLGSECGMNSWGRRGVTSGADV